MNIVEVRCITSGMTMSQHLFDPLPELAQIANDEGLWYHVDAAVGRIDVVPEPFIVRYLGKLRQRIDRTGVSCSCVGRDAERSASGISVASNSCFQCADIHAQFTVDSYQLQCIIRESSESYCLG